eukprot:Hpha_TRINITY_DN10106_c0_g2::TRINITY_DN10106_c0_g2_i1::g.131713::m.131713
MGNLLCAADSPAQDAQCSPSLDALSSAPPPALMSRRRGTRSASVFVAEPWDLFPEPAWEVLRFSSCTTESELAAGQLRRRVTAFVAVAPNTALEVVPRLANEVHRCAHTRDRAREQLAGWAARALALAELELPDGLARDTCAVCAATLRHLLLFGTTQEIISLAAEGIFEMLSAGHANSPAGEEARDAIAAAGLTAEAVSHRLRRLLDPKGKRKASFPLYSCLLLGAAVARACDPVVSGLGISDAEALEFVRLAAEAAVDVESEDNTDAACALIAAVGTSGHVSVLCKAFFVETEAWSVATIRRAVVPGRTGHGARRLILAALEAGSPHLGTLSPATFVSIAGPAVAGRADSPVCSTAADLAAWAAAQEAATSVDSTLELLLNAGWFAQAARLSRQGKRRVVRPDHIDAALAAGAAWPAAELLAAVPREVTTPDRLQALVTMACVSVSIDLTGALARLLQHHPDIDINPPPWMLVQNAITEGSKVLKETHEAAAETFLLQALQALEPSAGVTGANGSPGEGYHKLWQESAGLCAAGLLTAEWCSVSVRRAAAAACLRAGGDLLTACVLEHAARERAADLRLELLTRAMPSASSPDMSPSVRHRTRQALLLLVGDSEHDIAEKACALLVSVEAANQAQRWNGGNGSPVVAQSRILRGLFERAIRDAQGEGLRVELGLRLLRRLIQARPVHLSVSDVTELETLFLARLEGGSVRMRSAALYALEGFASACPGAAIRLRGSVLGRNEAGPELVRRACVATRAILHH